MVRESDQMKGGERRARKHTHDENALKPGSGMGVNRVSAMQSFLRDAPFLPLLHLYSRSHLVNFSSFCSESNKGFQMNIFLLHFTT